MRTNASGTCFCTLLYLHKCINGEQLGEGLSDELKHAIDVPGFGSGKLLKLLAGGEYNVSSVFDA